MSIWEKARGFTSGAKHHAVNSGKHSVAFAKRRPYSALVIGAVGLIVLYLIVTTLIEHPPLLSSKTPDRTVTLISVDEFSRSLEPIPVIGTVRSATEATILAESSGRITRVSGKLGGYVSAGTVIAEIENSGEYASVLQAQGALDAALAAASKVSGGTREEQLSILETTLASTEESLLSARNSSVTSLLASFSTVDDAIRGKTDQLFSNPTSNPDFTITTSDSSLVSDIENTRRLIETIRSKQTARAKTLSSSSSLTAEFESTQTELREVRNYLDKVVDALNKGIPGGGFTQATIDGYRATAETARGLVTGAITSLTGTEELLNGKTAARDIAKKNLEQGVTGGQTEDVQSAQAIVTQARAGLRAAESRYQKTLIRAPFPGTINSLSVDL